MAAHSEETLRCPVCHDIYKEPVLLSCSHSFCKSCLQTWWAGKKSLLCPLCKKKSSQKSPPLNLVLKNLCEEFSQKKTDKPPAESAARCSLHDEELKLFCLAHQQPVCLVCLHSETHSEHSVRPIEEAAREYKEGLRELLRPLQEKRELLTDIKESFDETAQDIEVQVKVAERQMREVFSMLRTFLHREEEERVGALREEGELKGLTMRRRSEDLSREISALSDTIGATEEVLREEGLPFLQRYNTAAELVHYFQSDDPQLTSADRIDANKHLNNLPFEVLDGVREKVASSLNPRNPETDVVSLGQSLSRLYCSSNNSAPTGP